MEGTESLSFGIVGFFGVVFTSDRATSAGRCCWGLWGGGGAAGLAGEAEEPCAAAGLLGESPKQAKSMATALAGVVAGVVSCTLATALW